MAEVVVWRGPSILKSEGGTILVLDASTSQTHSRSASATQYPVEAGSDITDHVHLGPLQLTIAGVISATPVGNETDNPGREVDGWAVLEQVIEERIPVTIVTTLRSYSNMVLTAISTAREGGQRAVFPQIEATQITYARSAVVDLPAQQVRKVAQKASAPAKKDAASQPTAEATAAQEAAAKQELRKSLLSRLLGAFG